MKTRVAAATGVTLVVAGGVILGIAAVTQHHAPQPSSAQAGSVSPARSASQSSSAEPAVHSLTLARSLPVSISIPDIGVTSKLMYVGLNKDGTLQAPPLNDPPLTNEAAWYKYSPTPGQLGPAIIEGHVDSAQDGPSVFFRLGSLKPGDLVRITLKDHQVAVFKISGVRSYPKDQFPTSLIYGGISYAGLRLITCGGSFDYATGHYLSNTVAFASLVSLAGNGSRGYSPFAVSHAWIAASRFR